MSAAHFYDVHLYQIFFYSHNIFFKILHCIEINNSVWPSSIHFYIKLNCAPDRYSMSMFDDSFKRQSKFEYA